MTSADEPAQVSADFVFGTLATDELRLAQLRAAAAGVHHGHDLEPLDPDPGEPITVRVTLGPAVDADHVTAYYTTDGRDPTGSHGVGGDRRCGPAHAHRRHVGHARLGVSRGVGGRDPGST